MKQTRVRALAEQVAAERIESLRNRLTNVPDVLAALTAGLDSRCICALMAHLDRPVAYFTGLDGTADTQDDARRSRRIAARLGLRWSCHPPMPITREMTIQIAYLSDGELRPFSAYPYWARHVHTRNGVILWGLGGEIWRDYWSKHEVIARLLKGATPIERLVRYRCETIGLPPDLLVPEFRTDARQRVIAMLEQTDRELPPVSPKDRLDMLYIIERFRRWASCHYMTASWWSLTEFPLVGQRMVDLAYRLPRNAKASSELMRWVIRLLHPTASRMPHNDGRATQPVGHHRFADHIRSGLLDTQRFLEKVGLRSARRAHRQTAGTPPATTASYRTVFADMLDPDQMRSAFLYQPEALRRLIDRDQDRIAGQSRALSTLIGIEAIARAATRLQC